MLFSIIRSGIVMPCNGNNYLVDRGNGLVAVCDIEGDLCKVLIRICELRVFQAHICGAFIGPLCLSLSFESEICLRIQRVADFHVIASHHVFFSIISRCIIVARDGYCNIDRIDRLIAVRDFKCNVCKVRICVCELASCQAHVRRSGIRPFRLCRSGEREVMINIIQSIIRSSCVAFHFMLFAVVRCCVVCTNDRDSHIDRFDRLIAVRYIERDCCKVRVRVCELLCFQAHVRCSSIRSLGLCCSCKANKSFLI